MFKLELSQEEIYDLLNGGDQTYDKIFKSVFGPLSFYISRLSDGANDGEDIAQETLEKFWNRRKKYDSVKTIMGFLLTTSRNAYINWAKREGVKRKYWAASKSDSDVLNINEPALVETAYISALHEEIEKLPDVCKQVFKLLYFKEFSSQEVAAILKTSTDNVRQQKSIAIAKLRAVMAAKKIAIIMILMIVLFGLKFFSGSFSYFCCLVVYPTVTTTNHSYFNH